MQILINMSQRNTRLNSDRKILGQVARLEEARSGDVKDVRYVHWVLCPLGQVK